MTGATIGVEHVVLGPHAMLTTLLKLAQTGVGVVFPVEQEVERATAPPSAYVAQLVVVAHLTPVTLQVVPVVQVDVVTALP